MAKAIAVLPDEILSRLSTLGGRADEVAEKMLTAGGEVALKAVKTNLRAVIGSGTKYESRSTGTLVSYLGVSPPKQDANGNYDIKVGFEEPRPDGESNAKIATILEHGKSGQKAKPFMKPAKSACKSDVAEAMKRVFESEVGKI